MSSAAKNLPDLQLDIDMNSAVPNAVAAGIRRPATFLSLAPVHSASFPQGPVTPRLSATAYPSKVSSPASATSSPVSEHAPMHRASSSSSIGSVTEKKRFLKLGAVHWGGIPGEDDYAVED